MNLIRIDFERGQLKTPEHTYLLASSLSIARYIEFEKKQAGAAYGVTFDDIHKAWCDVEDALNKVKFVEAAAIIANMKQAILRGGDKKKHLVLQICALFLNEEGEDVGVYREEVMDAKIQDWLDSGVDYKDFFQFTVNIVPGLLAVLQQTSTVISGQADQTQKTGEELTRILKTDKKKSNDSGQ